MRILFSGNPLAGHLLPMMPLADAACGCGHETAMLTSGDLASLVAPMHVLSAGPSIEEMVEETVRRIGPPPPEPGPDKGELFCGVPAMMSLAEAVWGAELFAGVRVEWSLDEALRQADAFGPDLLICDAHDCVGPMVAAALSVPWAAHAVTGPLPTPFWRARRERVSREYRNCSLTKRSRIALVDPYPDALRALTEQPPADRITIRPAVRDCRPTRPGEQDLPSERPCALVTLEAPGDHRVALSALATSVAAAGFTAIVTARRADLPAEIDPDQVRPLGYVPLARLLPQVDLVVTAGETGTVLASLSHGLPMVIRPSIADQPWNAARLAFRGAGIVIDDVAEAGAAARQIAEDPAYRAVAKSIAVELASLNSPGTVLQRLLARVAAS